MGRVVGPVRGDSHSPGGLHFRLRDVNGSTTVEVVYAGSKPDMFGVDRDVYLEGRVVQGVFVGSKDSLVTKCPSKYQPRQKH